MSERFGVGVCGFALVVSFPKFEKPLTRHLSMRRLVDIQELTPVASTLGIKHCAAFPSGSFRIRCAEFGAVGVRLALVSYVPSAGVV